VAADGAGVEEVAVVEDDAAGGDHGGGPAAQLQALVGE
jgi:hypothetical protein